VSVLTVDPSCYAVHDPSFDVDADVEVVHTGLFDPVVRFTRNAETEPAVASENGARDRRGSGWRVLARHAWNAVEQHLLIPDRTVLWYRQAVNAGLRLQGQHPFDLVFATGEPYSAFLIASRIARRARIPFVLDMRDPWTLLPYRNARPTPLRSAIERRQEARVLRDCAACLFANRSVDDYRSAFPDLQHKFHYVPNGYDPEDFTNVQPKSFDRFTIVHNGSFLPGYRTSDVFLTALRTLLDADPTMRERVRVAFVGRVGEERAVTERLQLQDVVRHVGYLPHVDSLSYVLGADVLLLVGGSRRWEETGKVFEYLAAGRPVLALVEPDGGAAELLRRAPAAHVVSRTSVPETVCALRTLINAGRRPAEPLPAWLREYRRDELSARVAGILERPLTAVDAVAVSA